MNHEPIPFLAAFDTDTTHWLRVLQQAMPSERLVLLQDMSYDERMLCDVAIVANPTQLTYSNCRICNGCIACGPVWSACLRISTPLICKSFAW